MNVYIVQTENMIRILSVQTENMIRILSRIFFQLSQEGKFSVVIIVNYEIAFKSKRFYLFVCFQTCCYQLYLKPPDSDSLL